jgi:hypothetical protein
MSWYTSFQAWKEAGKTVEWMTARVNVLLQGGYINQTEYDEIMLLINS